MGATRFKIISTILLTGILTLLLGACGGGGGEEGTPETTSVEITVGFPEEPGAQPGALTNSSAGSIPMLFQGSAADVDRVTVDVFDDPTLVAAPIASVGVDTSGCRRNSCTWRLVRHD